MSETGNGQWPKPDHGNPRQYFGQWPDTTPWVEKKCNEGHAWTEPPEQEDGPCPFCDARAHPTGEEE